MIDRRTVTRITPKRWNATLVAIFVIGCSSAEVTETVHPGLVDLDPPKSLSVGLVALADHAQSLNAQSSRANDELTDAGNGESGEPTSDADESDGVEVDNRAFASIAELCATFVAESKANAPQLLEMLPEGVEPLKAPYCTAISEPHAVPANSIYERTVTLRLSNGVWERKQLAVKLSRGFILHPSYWDADDPMDPGCASIFRTERIEPLRVESGYLVVVETGRMYADTNAQGEPVFTTVHGATWCKESEGRLECRMFVPSYSTSLDDFAIGPDGSLFTANQSLD